MFLVINKFCVYTNFPQIHFLQSQYYLLDLHRLFYINKIFFRIKSLKLFFKKLNWHVTLGFLI